MVDQNVCDPIVADTVDRYSRLIHPLPSTVVMNVVAVGQMTSGFQLRSIATASLRDLATNHPVISSTFALKGLTAHVPDRTTDDSIMRTVL